MKKATENKAIHQPETTKEIPKLLGGPEFGEYMGWHRAHVREYLMRKREGKMDDGFPLPFQMVGKRPVWTIEQVRAYALANKHKVRSGGKFWEDEQVHDIK